MINRLLLGMAFCALGLPVFGQINLNKVLERSVKKAEKSVENRVERRIDNGVDKTLDGVEGSVDDAVKGDANKKEFTSKTDSGKKESTTKTDNSGAAGTQKSETSQPATPTAQDESKPVLEWAKYDFVPGSETIFEDLQQGETNGEFPSKWDLAGGVIENAVFDGGNVIFFRQIGNTGGIVPLMSHSQDDFLPDEFTIEFDAYFEKEVYSQRYNVSLYSAKKQKSALGRLVVYTNQVQYGNTDISGIYPGADRSNIDKQARWRHVAISFNKRALKVYLDDARVLNVPNIEGNPTGLTISTTSQNTGYYFVRNVRIAKGAVPLYDKVLTDGKYVTHGIRFDVNKAIIKSESMGTINYVYKMMADNPTLNFMVEGHTDADGDDALNLKLSEARAKSVMEQLVAMGVASSRLKAKGWGETKPLSVNDTPEGKSKNRRVEFVKF